MPDVLSACLNLKAVLWKYSEILRCLLRCTEEFAIAWKLLHLAASLSTRPAFFRHSPCHHLKSPNLCSGRGIEAADAYLRPRTPAVRWAKASSGPLRRCQEAEPGQEASLEASRGASGEDSDGDLWAEPSLLGSSEWEGSEEEAGWDEFSLPELQEGGEEGGEVGELQEAVKSVTGPAWAEMDPFFGAVRPKAPAVSFAKRTGRQAAPSGSFSNNFCGIL